MEINGFNEDITGWGRSDSEMIVRMMNKGVYARRIRYRGILYHIWHKENSRARVEKNLKIEQNAIFNKAVRCPNGIDKYLNEKKI
jgi:hypothetical protein